MKNETDQAKAIRSAKAALEATTAELAERLGVSVPTLNSWLLPRSAKAHRPMPTTAKLLLGYIVADAKRGVVRRR